MTTPLLIVELELEGNPRALVLSPTYEDEMCLRRWLTSPVARRRILQAVECALDDLAGRRAA